MQQKSVRPRLPRTLGLREGIAIQIGMIIGSGIFLVPATVAGRLPALVPILLVWILGGLSILCGALTRADQGAVGSCENTARAGLRILRGISSNAGRGKTPTHTDSLGRMEIWEKD